MDKRIDGKTALKESYFRQINNYQSYQEEALFNSNIKMFLQRTSDKCDQDKKMEKGQGQI